MTALKPVGVNTTFATSTTSAKTGNIAHKTDTVRVVAVGAGVHVAIGTNPTATVDDFYVHTTEIGEISLGAPQSQRVVNITKGSTTILDFPEGTGSPFSVGDACSLTVTGQSAFDFEHKIVTAVNNTSNIHGYFGTRITVDHNSSGVGVEFNSPYAELRSSFQVAVVTNSGTGTVFIQQVQTS